MDSPEIIEVDPDSRTVACDGGRLFGHPVVYLTFTGKDYVDCYYCGRRFLKNPSVEPGGAVPPAA